MLASEFRPCLAPLAFLVFARASPTAWEDRTSSIRANFLTILLNRPKPAPGCQGDAVFQFHRGAVLQAAAYAGFTHCAILNQLSENPVCGLAFRGWRITRPLQVLHSARILIGPSRPDGSGLSPALNAWDMLVRV